MIIRDLERFCFCDHEQAAGWSWEQEPGQDGIPRVTQAAVVPLDGGQIFSDAAIAMALEELYQLMPTMGSIGGRDQWLIAHHDMLLARAERMYQQEVKS